MRALIVLPQMWRLSALKPVMFVEHFDVYGAFWRHVRVIGVERLLGPHIRRGDETDHDCYEQPSRCRPSGQLHHTRQLLLPYLHQLEPLLITDCTPSNRWILPVTLTPPFCQDPAHDLRA